MGLDHRLIAAHFQNVYRRKFLVQPPDQFNGGAGFGFDDKIRTYTILVTDSKGAFRKSASFRQSLQPPCAIPTGDPALNFCIPSSGEVTTSPLRVAGVARASVGVSWIQVWADGVQYWAKHVAGTADMKMLNNYIYLANGTHTVTMIAKLADGTSIKKSMKVQIVSTP